MPLRWRRGPPASASGAASSGRSGIVAISTSRAWSSAATSPRSGLLVAVAGKRPELGERELALVAAARPEARLLLGRSPAS